MPFLRVLRDKRGLETTYLMHLFREGTRSRSRILYMFRSPQGTQVGGQALDPQARAELCRLYPDVPFDWRELVAHQQVVEMAEPFRPRRRRKAPDEAPDEAQDEAPEEMPDEAAAAVVPDADESTTEDEEPSATTGERPQAVPAAIGGSTPEEQIAWLAEWHPKVRDLIPQRFHDEVRRQALGALAARLDPSSWADDASRAEGLRDAAESWGRLARVFSRRRRRGRRRPGGGRPAGQGGAGEGGAGQEPA